jgi:hypothetical protein
MYVFDRIKHHISTKLFSSVESNLNSVDFSLKQFEKDNISDVRNIINLIQQKTKEIYSSKYSVYSSEERLFSQQEVNLKSLIITLRVYHIVLSKGNSSKSVMNYSHIKTLYEDSPQLLLPSFISDIIIVQVIEAICSSLFNGFLNREFIFPTVSYGFLF